MNLCITMTKNLFQKPTSNAQSFFTDGDSQIFESFNSQLGIVPMSEQPLATLGNLEASSKLLSGSELFCVTESSDGCSAVTTSFCSGFSTLLLLL